MNPATRQYDSAYNTWSKTIFTRRQLVQRTFAGVFVLSFCTFFEVGFRDDFQIPAGLVAVTILTGLILQRSGVDVAQFPKPGRITRWSKLFVRYYSSGRSLEGAKWISLVQRRRTKTSNSDNRSHAYYIYAVEFAFDSDKFSICEFHSYEPARELADELSQICDVRLSDYVRGNR